jgi:uncharacterized protein YoxC
MKRRSTRTALAVWLGLWTAGLLGALAVAGATLSQVRVLGPLHEEIAAVKELGADVLPPPLYLIEPSVTVLEASKEADPKKVAELAGRGRRLRAAYDASFRAWSASLRDDALRELLLGRAHAKAQQFFSLEDEEYFPALRAGDRGRAAAALRALVQLHEEQRALIDEAVTRANARNVALEGAARQSVARRLWLLAALGLATLVAGALLFRALLRWGTRVDHTFDETGRGTDALTTACAQILEASQSLSQSAAEQARSLEDTTAALSEITGSISSNAEGCRVSEQMAKKSSQDAAESGAAVAEMVEAMRRITGKVSILEEIAQQTTLLALNASIESARAGAQGKGFVVVAEEVQRLAERSRAAAREIAGLSGESLGVTERTGRLIATLVPAIRGTCERIQEVTAGSTEQAASVAELEAAVGQMNHVTRDNAALAERLGAAISDLGREAATLQGLAAASGAPGTGSAGLPSAP